MSDSTTGAISNAIPKAISNEELRQMLQTIFGRLPDPDLTRENTALMIVDMQYVDAHPDYGLGARAKELGFGPALDYYWSRMGELVVPNIQRLLATARRNGIEVLHLRVASQTQDGRDSTLRYKALGLRTPRDTKEAEILPELAPEGDELVISKVTSSAFHSTNIDRLLRNLGIRNLIITGVVTNGCVESTARSAAEYDYGTIVVEDATAAMAPQLHEHSILSMSYKDAVIKSTDEVIKLLEGSTSYSQKP
jgi:nicotinamidase-related amidase